MANSLQEHLTKQAPTPAGIHEGVASHTEDVFDSFQGILPFFLGKRNAGPFINLTLPKIVTESSEALLQTIADLICIYDLRLISFVSAIRIQYEENAPGELSAILITADKGHTYFQLPWRLEFNKTDDLVAHKRATFPQDIIPREIWSQLFSAKVNEADRTVAFDRLIERFGGQDELPQP